MRILPGEQTKYQANSQPATTPTHGIRRTPTTRSTSIVKCRDVLNGNRDGVLNKAANDVTRFTHRLRKDSNLEVKSMGADGNCLFRSVADQIYGDQEMHDQVRERCMNYMSQERDHFGPFVDEDFDQYIERKKRDRCFGNHLEIQAIGEIYNRPVIIYQWKDDDAVEEIKLFEGAVEGEDNPPIRLSYHDKNHYNSIIDPDNPSVGVGLGLPGLHPMGVEKEMLNYVAEESMNERIEHDMMKLTQMESEANETEDMMNEMILEQSMREAEERIMRESQIEYMNQMYQSRRT
ncbi:hypothetical protein PROFUN_01809 [Planoprotostelium fungivorum]|uniref:ubiquitinyl hydrolase 1 n=1 Tax=Planoprotostelium fungivorum TaxID=1890364 RepID=A0A2P6NYS4_9EUKA|nr:hypothetical protein PROFUN_01809 [Planoprotostelium fungivorum]